MPDKHGLKIQTNVVKRQIFRVFTPLNMLSLIKNSYYRMTAIW